MEKLRVVLMKLKKNLIADILKNLLQIKNTFADFTNYLSAKRDAFILVETPNSIDDNG